MRYLPVTQNALVLRTDFSDGTAWKSVCAQIQAPVGGFRANVDCISDPQYEGLTAEKLIKRVRPGEQHTFVFLADGFTLSHREHPVLVVDLYDEPGRTFRVIPTELWAVENNLSIANMDFYEFAEAVDPDGVFRGFEIG
jgi:hypothetical protein